MLLCIFVCVGGGGKMTLEDGSCDVQEQAQKLHEAICLLRQGVAQFQRFLPPPPVL